LLRKTGDSAAALEQLREAQKVDAHNASIDERIGDLEAGLNHLAEARAAYEARCVMHRTPKPANNPQEAEVRRAVGP
jgi:Flp pilus assembly protein TadD